MILDIIKTELTEIKNQYGDDRRTEIDVTSIEYIEDESLIPVEDVVITVTNKGYIKRVPIDTYKTQNRGSDTRAVMGSETSDFRDRTADIQRFG